MQEMSINKKGECIIMKRILICVITLCCLLTACSVSNETLPNTQDISVLESTKSKVYEIVPEGTPLDEFADYDSIIEEYHRFAGYAIEFDDEYYKQVDDLDLWYNRGWMGWFIACFSISRIEGKEDFGYAIKDLNGNGSPELILAMGDQVIRAIFALIDDKPKLLDEFGDKHHCEIDSSGIFYIRTTSGGDLTKFASYQISQNDEELVLIDEFGTNGHDMDTLETFYYKMMNGFEQRITSEEFDELYDRFFDDSHSTKNSEIKFTPLFE
jgi:hypothetical protein